MKIVRLEKALEVLQDCYGPEIEGLKSALEKAENPRGQPPLENKIKRVAAETVLLEDARQRLGRLEQRDAVPTVPEEAAGGVVNVDFFQARLAEAAAERDETRRAPGPETTGPVGPQCPDSSNASGRGGVV